jgi:hypothetical protein
MKRVALYVRVSTASKSRKGDLVAFDQDPEVQEAPLRQLIAGIDHVGIGLGRNLIGTKGVGGCLKDADLLCLVQRGGGETWDEEAGAAYQRRLFRGHDR